MLELMQKEAAIEVTADLKARIHRYEKDHGKSEATQQDREAILGFKKRVKTDDVLEWSDVFAFSKKWLDKYPNKKLRLPTKRK